MCRKEEIERDDRTNGLIIYIYIFFDSFSSIFEKSSLQTFAVIYRVINRDTEQGSCLEKGKNNESSNPPTIHEYFEFREKGKLEFVIRSFGTAKAKG